MATIDEVQATKGDGTVVVTWEALNAGDDGSPVLLSAYPDKTAQAIGDATSVAIQGSMDGTNWFALDDPQGTTIALAGATNDMAAISQNPLYIRPVATGGTDTDVILLAVHTNYR